MGLRKGSEEGWLDDSLKTVRKARPSERGGTNDSYKSRKENGGTPADSRSRNKKFTTDNDLD